MPAEPEQLEGFEELQGLGEPVKLGSSGQFVDLEAAEAAEAY